MAHAFAPIPAKPTFGTFRKNLYQSDYITRKTAKIIYCNTKNKCGRLLIASDYNKRSLFNAGKDAINLLRCDNVAIPINKSNLIMGQYTKLDLSNVCTVLNTNNYSAIDCLKNITGCPNNYSAIDCLKNITGCPNSTPVTIPPATTTPAQSFYQNNIIDPCGYLFGNTQCGELNFTSYMVLNPPTIKRTVRNNF